MSKRNIFILIISLIILAFIAFRLFSLYKPKVTSENPTDNIKENFISDFFSFGNKTNTKNPENNTPSEKKEPKENPEPPIEIQKMKLNKISSMPIAGFSVFTKERFTPLDFKNTTEESAINTSTETPLTEFASALRYIDKKNGNIYQTFVDNINERKFSDTTILGIHEVFFGKDAEEVILRYLKTSLDKNSNVIKPGKETIETFTGKLPKEILGGDSINKNKLTGSFLPEDIINISISPDLSKIFYLFGWKNGVIGTTAFFSGEEKTQIFDSPFTEWLSQWPNKELITLTTKPASSVLGYMYAINPETESFNKILGGVNGLTTLTSPNGNLVLFNDNNLSLKIYNIKTKKYQTLGIKTLPEKCVWNDVSSIIYCSVPKNTYNQSNYPENWYQGEISFSDNIWRVDVESGQSTMILDTFDTKNIDGINLKLDLEEKYLFFINKKDSYLWGLELD